MHLLSLKLKFFPCCYISLQMHPVHHCQFRAWQDWNKSTSQFYICANIDPKQGLGVCQCSAGRTSFKIMLLNKLSTYPVVRPHVLLSNPKEVLQRCLPTCSETQGSDKLATLKLCWWSDIHLALLGLRDVSARSSSLWSRVHWYLAQVNLLLYSKLFVLVFSSTEIQEKMNMLHWKECS